MSKEIEFTVTCSAVEELLIAESIGALTNLEAIRLRQHLRACPACRSQRQFLSRFGTALDVDGAPELTAPPVSPILRAAVEANRPTPFLLRLLQTRIPVYQAVLGAAAALFLLLAATRLGPDSPGATLPLSAPGNPEYARVDSYEVLEQFKLLDSQTRGRDHTGDSLLIRYTTSIQPADSI